MFSARRTPSSGPSSDSELDTLPARAGQQRGLTSAIAHELNGGRRLRPPRPCSPSPFDSPTSNHKSSAAARDAMKIQDLMENIYVTWDPPDHRISAWGTPTRRSSRRKGEDNDEEEDDFVSHGNRPQRIRCVDNDPVRRFLAAEFYKMADRPASQSTASGSASPPGFRSASPTPCSSKRTASTLEEQDKALDAFTDNDGGDRPSTRLTPEMDEWEPFGNMSASSGRSAKRAKRLGVDSDSEYFTKYQWEEEPTLATWLWEFFV
ncbi:hypothetical protein F4813DRAFT_386408 [Daldinia decipiens]|uniref:uncharacterized protein n=1 Tax=Daldinia decipiens TaxID=326647 RepID=UPI0020C45774|nr:uncharacterized protein F4813DRAFT_386408 [Daldinia decipiens]KAI1661000.1 hypothetical protein F4813DRAFT_386408 [Daldinia decipiens]